MARLFETTPGPFAGEPDGYHAAACGVIRNGFLMPRATMSHALRLLADPASRPDVRAGAFRCLGTVVESQILEDAPRHPRGQRGTWSWRSVQS